MAQTSLLVGCRLRELVEDVEVTLISHLADNTAFLEQIIGDLSSDRFSMVVEHDLEVFALDDSVSQMPRHSSESPTHVSTRVVVAEGFRTSEALKEGVRCEYHVLYLLDATVLATRYDRDVLHYAFCGLGLPRP
jgi:hypothetical protein